MLRNKGIGPSIIFLAMVFMLITTNYQNSTVSGWSSEIATHGEIAVSAVDVMPEPWKTFFMDKLIDLSDSADYPDDHKDVDLLERERHFDDSDIPHDDHTSLGGSDDWSWGVISWAAENATRDLTQLIKDDASDEDLIYQFGFVSHYAADSSMPFHATSNFDGQFTNNRGVHQRLEEIMFLEYGEDIFANITLNEPKYIDDPYASTKENIATGLALVPDYLAVDTVALAEAELAQNLAVYTSIFYNLLNQSIIERISLAVQFTADLWYTAIVNAEPPSSSSASETTSTTTSLFTTTTSSKTTTSSSTNDDAGQYTLGITLLMTLLIMKSRKITKY